MNTTMLTIGSCSEVGGVESQRMIIDSLYVCVSIKLEHIQCNEERHM